MLRRFVAAVLALTLPFAAAAQTAGAVVESLRGVAQVGNTAIREGQRLSAPTAVSTQAGAQALLRFDDGMQILLAESSLLRIVDFRYGSGGDRAVFELLRGSARVVTGRVAANDASQFFFRTPQAEFKVEDASDFSVALVNPAYVMVHSGRVVAGNGQGTAVLNAGSTSVIASGNSVPAAIATSAMPPLAASSLNSLSVAALSSPFGGSMAGFGGVGGAAQAAHQWLILGLIAAAIIVVVAAQDDDNPTTSHH
jgi:ferric-dicitrate binding protein FerR (iron transport regulator)